VSMRSRRARRLADRLLTFPPDIRPKALVSDQAIDVVNLARYNMNYAYNNQDHLYRSILIAACLSSDPTRQKINLDYHLSLDYPSFSQL
jgi:hypothetical protein